MNNPKELQTKIEQLRQEIVDAKTNSAWEDCAANIAKKHSEIFVLASQLSEISTRRIVRLTWALVILSIALLFFTVWLVIFPKN
jgi:hypothetical protein